MRLVRSVQMYGRPVPQGSLRAMRTPSGAIVTPQSNKVLAYRNDLRAGWGEPTPVVGAVSLVIGFLFERPKSHFRPATKSRPYPEQRDDAPYWVTTKPDLDKLVRSVMDALTGYAFKDDQQVIRVVAYKRWSTVNSTVIELWEES